MSQAAVVEVVLVGASASEQKVAHILRGAYVRTRLGSFAVSAGVPHETVADALRTVWQQQRITQRLGQRMLKRYVLELTATATDRNISVEPRGPGAAAGVNHHAQLGIGLGSARNW